MLLTDSQYDWNTVDKSGDLSENVVFQRLDKIEMVQRNAARWTLNNYSKGTLMHQLVLDI